MRMLERLLDEEHIGELDLGTGDELYKRLWASRRRERVGLVAFDPLTLRGAAGAFRHWAIGSIKPTQAHALSGPQMRRSAEGRAAACHGRSSKAAPSSGQGRP